MKRVLYMTNIEVPYRVRFFNELAKHCDLTVLYEKRTFEQRDQRWAQSEETTHRREYLKNEHLWFNGIMKYVCGNYDVIIVGCYNSPVQMLAMLIMRLYRIPFTINLDGEPFLNGKGLKNRAKHFFLSGAEQYLVAGEKAAESLRKIAGDKRITPYYFSSLTEEELEAHGKFAGSERNQTVLVIGQYFDYKGMDVALEAARMDSTIRYKFVGMGTRTDMFRKENDIPENVQVIPFLQKEDLEKEYQTCGMLVLPSRQECWGLVINEAASFGMPIVSTWGSGAAVEFLADNYPQFLAQPGDAESLLGGIRQCMESDKQHYTDFLVSKSREYFREKSVVRHLRSMHTCEEFSKWKKAW